MRSQWRSRAAHVSLPPDVTTFGISPSFPAGCADPACRGGPAKETRAPCRRHDVTVKYLHVEAFWGWRSSLKWTACTRQRMEPLPTAVKLNSTLNRVAPR